MPSLCRISLGSAMLFGLASTLSSQTFFVSSIDGDQQVPPVVTAAAGSATALLDGGAASLSYEITLSGVDLDGNQTPGDANDNVTALHFHRGSPGQPGRHPVHIQPQYDTFASRVRAEPSSRQ